MDEAAFSCLPYLQRTYHRKGQRCVVTHGPLRGTIQTISLITSTGRLYFQIKRGSFKGTDVVAFLLDVLKRYRRKKLIITWDGAPIHRSKQVKEFLRTRARGRLHLVQLPPYSPQLNADEQVHGLIKTNDFKNRLFTTLDELEDQVVRSFENLAAKPKTIASFFRHKEVGLYPT